MGGYMPVWLHVRKRSRRGAAVDTSRAFWRLGLSYEYMNCRNKRIGKLMINNRAIYEKIKITYTMMYKELQIQIKNLHRLPWETNQSNGLFSSATRIYHHHRLPWLTPTPYRVRFISPHSSIKRTNVSILSQNHKKFQRASLRKLLFTSGRLHVTSPRGRFALMTQHTAVWSCLVV